jgi:uncharacterized protein (UPF0276 family)
MALFIERHSQITFLEVLAEDFHNSKCIPRLLLNFAEKGMEFIVHSTSLNLAGAQPPEPTRLAHVNEIARALNAVCVSDHIAFVKAPGLATGHLVPPRRTSASLRHLLYNLEIAREHLQLPLVLENIATTFDWPNNEMSEAAFLREALEKSDSKLLLDVSNLFANAHNLTFDYENYLNALPLDRLFYVHIAGGIFKQGLYHDTHCHSLKEESLAVLRELAKRKVIPRVLLERDDDFSCLEEIEGELAAIEKVIKETPIAYCTVPPPLPPEAGPTKAKQTPLNPDELANLAREQTQLVQALMVTGLAPAGFDSERITEAYQALRRKRVRTMKRACAALEKIFQTESALDSALAIYMNAHPSVSLLGPAGDALNFVLELSQGKLKVEGLEKNKDYKFLVEQATKLKHPT